MHLNFRFPVNIQTGSISTDHLFNIIRRNGYLPIFVSSQEENKNRADFHFFKKKVHQNKYVSYFSLPNNPEFSQLNTITRYVHLTNCNLIVIFGGLYSLNIAKVIATATNYKCSIDELYIDKINLKNQKKTELVHIFYIPSYIQFGLEYSSSFFLYSKDFGYKMSNYSSKTLVNNIYIDSKIYSNKLENYKLSFLSLIGFNIDCLLSKNSNLFTTEISVQSLNSVINSINQIMEGIYELEQLKSQLIFANHFLGIAYLNTQAGIFYTLASSIYFCTNLKMQEAMSILLPHLLDYLLNDNLEIYDTILSVFKKEKLSDIMTFIKEIYSHFNLPTQLKSYEIDKSLLPIMSDIAYESPFFKISKKELSKKELDAIFLMCY